MLKEEISSGGNNWSRVCDTCRAAACTVYCKADSAYLCSSCDARVHAANNVASRHERVWVCEACERAPAAFLCKADVASLCAACDADIHSANSLASRHQRIPIPPVSGSLYSPGDAGEDENAFMTREEDETTGEEDEDEAASWLLLNPEKKMNANQNNNGYMFGGEVDEYLHISEFNSCTENQYSDHQYNQQHYSTLPQNSSYGGDSVVPVQSGEGKDHQQYHNLQLAFDYESSKAAYSYNGSLSQSLSVSSIDVGVVPETTVTSISVTPPKGLMDLFPSTPIQMPTQLSLMDREARVLRYREKKKTRKFEKTIRYASRKAYAETRPRIKGRFAKRTDAEVEVDQMFPTALMAKPGYGLVPSF